MCVVSMVGDHYGDKWDQYRRQITPFPTVYPTQTAPQIINTIELQKLREEVQEMKELLKKAIQYDKDNNQPDCEKPEKIAFLKRMAEMVGITLDDVFGGDNATQTGQ